MKNITKEFKDAKVEFLKSNGSEKSVEKLYDIIYFLKDLKEPTFDEKFILAKIYNMVGSNIYASKIVKESLKTSGLFQTIKLKALASKIESQDIWNIKIYSDLRDSKIKKVPTKLSIEDLVVSVDVDGSYCVGISAEVKNIVLLNKNFTNEDIWGDGEGYFIFSEKKPDVYLLESIIEYLIWLGQISDELLGFYNQANFRHKLLNVGENWFDGLSVFDFSVYIDENGDFNTEILLHDYIQNDFGFHLEIVNKDFKQIKYNPEL
jgi:hypothetical protein